MNPHVQPSAAETAQINFLNHLGIYDSVAAVWAGSTALIHHFMNTDISAPTVVENGIILAAGLCAVDALMAIVCQRRETRELPIQRPASS